jgi:hypothetical protein
MADNDDNELGRKTREAAWLAYQERLGNLTSREESLVERAFKAGWSAAAK